MPLGSGEMLKQTRPIDLSRPRQASHKAQPITSLRRRSCMSEGACLMRRVGSLLAGLITVIQFAIDSSLAQTPDELDSCAPPIKFPLLLHLVIVVRFRRDTR